jgi:hypothetical protein
VAKKPLNLEISKEWLVQKAALEGDHEIGAGKPDYIPGFVPSAADRHYDRRIRDLYSLKNSVEAENAHLRAAMIEACDLLAERVYGNAARSPGHNARVVLEWALKPNEKEPTNA